MQVHDIEDLVRVGRANKACPYFMARQLSGNAQLVFCPYTYLLDPLVRAAMEVDVEGAVLIFDEAHNIEDVARWGHQRGCGPARSPPGLAAEGGFGAPHPIVACVSWGACCKAQGDCPFCPAILSMPRCVLDARVLLLTGKSLPAD